MKMTLSSSANNSPHERQSINIDNKSLSPSSSPRSSPKPSPKPQDKREHSRSETHLTVNYKEPSPILRSDGSPSSVDSASNNRGSSSNVDLCPSPNELIKSESGNIYVKDKERKEGRTKKKSSWFNSFYPTYKSRSEDFKRIFKDVPDDERLVVDYSCALQKEILVHGRLYVTQNYLCFYANIFGWETNVTLKWKEVAAITKEKTALVIPNAVLICTRADKLFFTSFVARDKTYLMLFRVWQNALMDQPMSAPEMWQWVHQSYGDKLGLTSDDEDYIAPGTEEDKLSARLSVDSFSEEGGNNIDLIMNPLLLDDKNYEETHPSTPLEARHKLSDSRIPSDMSDTTESDIDKPANPLVPIKPISREFSYPLFISSAYSDDNEANPVLPNSECEAEVRCTSPHEGKQVMKEIFHIHIDQLFTLLFTSSKFILDFHASRKTTDLTQTPWTHNPSNNSKSRIINLTVPVTQAMGPKTSQVTETQIMLPCSKPGQFYSVDSEIVNAGIPYADSFYITYHYCIRKISETQSSVLVYGHIKYRKSVWSLVKSMIEKNVLYGLDEFFGSLAKALHLEEEENIPSIKRRSRRKKRTLSMPRPFIDDSLAIKGSLNRTKSINKGSFINSEVGTLFVFIVLILLVFLNVMLYFKLWSLEDAPPYTLLDLHILKNPPKSHEEWIKLLQQQETLHSVEMQKWQRILKTSIDLLKQTEESLSELQRSIHPTSTEKVMSILQSYKDNTETKDEF